MLAAVLFAMTDLLLAMAPDEPPKTDLLPAKRADKAGGSLIKVGSLKPPVASFSLFKCLFDLDGSNWKSREEQGDDDALDRNGNGKTRMLLCLPKSWAGYRPVNLVQVDRYRLMI